MTEFATCNTTLCNVVGLLITALQLGQFIPQHYEMATDKSVVGVSPWLLFFSSLYTYLAALDILLLDGPQSFTCRHRPFQCFIQNQPILQMVGSAILSCTMWYWYLKYHRDIADTEDPEEQKLDNVVWYSNMRPTVVFKLFIVFAMGFNVIAFVLISGFGSKSSAVEAFAYFCGILSAGLNAMMWIPQIIVTYNYGHKGALSLGWVLASVVMDITYSAYLAFMGVNWTVWANNVPDGVQTGILLIMLLRFEHRDSQMGLDDYGHALVPSSEEKVNDSHLETNNLITHNHSGDKHYINEP